jgi:hypothetical protein
MFGNNVNTVPTRNVYSTAPGATLGVASTAFSPYDMGTSSQSAAMQADGSTASTSDTAAAGAAKSSGFLGQPFTWWLILVVLLIALKFVAQKLGDGEEFKSIRVSIHNVVIIALAAIIGIGFFKVIFNRWPVPGLTTFVNAV